MPEFGGVSGNTGLLINVYDITKLLPSVKNGGMSEINPILMRWAVAYFTKRL